MQKTEVEAKIRQAIPDADIEVEGADCSFSVVVLSQEFEKMGSGALHALSVKAHTPGEWAKLQQS